MPEKLSAYHAKRNFGVTPEPKGAVARSAGRPRFVVQKHHARRLHYDFRLELEGTLKSWAVPKGPSLDPGEKRLAVHVEDHPLDYIDFEGDIPEHQYGAGHVDVWDTGYWEPQGDPAEGYRTGKLKFRLEGEKLHGGWTLVRTRLQASGNKEQWLLIKERDAQARPAGEFDITEEMPHSVLSKPPVKKSGKNAGPSPARPKASAPAALENATSAPLPSMLRPQLATLVDAIPRTGDWEYEIKFDGYRVLARVDNDEVRLFTRDGNDWTARLPHQEKAIRELGIRSAWLDGEIVVLDRRGMPSFQLLQNAFRDNSPARVVYFLFDLPHLDGRDLRKAPLGQRRALLQQLLEHVPEDGPLRYSAALHESPQRLLDSACATSMEGIIGKRVDSVYVERRSSDWIKLKCRQRQEFVVIGFTEPQGSRDCFGALLLGVYDDEGRLRYAGRVGTGFDSKTLQSVHRQLKPLEQDKPPFDKPPSGLGKAQTHWLRPELVAEISFAEWTHEHLLRQAVFHGLRLDKPAAQVRREEAASTPAGGRNGATRGAVSVQGVKITNADRVIDPSTGLRKLDLVRYYEYAAPGILPFLDNRPVYLLRAPEGINGEQFFQKHNTRRAIPGVGSLDPALDPERAPLMVIESAQALVGAAQMGTIELHISNATADRIERPDCMVFDLDPDPSLPWQSVIEGARMTRLVLDELGLKSFIKTSGGKGLHLVVPLTRRHDWDEVAAFSHAVVRHMTHILPQRFSARMGEKNRIGKIFIDYLRNRRQASTVAPYSVRARPGLPVAAPLAWDELDDLPGPAPWNITTLAERLAGLDEDPWKDYFRTRQTITAAMKSRLE